MYNNKKIKKLIMRQMQIFECLYKEGSDVQIQIDNE